MKEDHDEVMREEQQEEGDGKRRRLILSDRLVRLCTSQKSVSGVLAAKEAEKEAEKEEEEEEEKKKKKRGVARRLSAGQAWEMLFDGDDNGGVDNNCKEGRKKGLDYVDGKGDGDDDDDDDGDDDELKKAERCGNWGGIKPSELFLKIYHDALCTLEEDLSRGVVSPSLMGSHGTVPLTVISVMPDIVRHMSNVIARAEKEVFLATNYWANSVASKYITNALRELDRRAGKRGTRVVLKILYDRGSPKHAVQRHYLVGEKEYTGTKVDLPHPNEIPNLDMQVMNYHTPLVGTFHAKYAVIDRKIALLQSNNIQDNDNLEMLVHLEGPIVDSFYDMALMSWHKRMEPPLPSTKEPTAKEGKGEIVDGMGNGHAVGEKTGGVHENGTLVHHHPGEESQHSLNQRLGQLDIKAPNENTDKTDGAADNHLDLLPEHTSEDPHYDDTISDEVARINAALSPKPNETHLQAVTRLLNHTVNPDFPADAKAPACLDPESQMTPYIPSRSNPPTQIPMALVNRAPYGPPSHKSVSNPQNAAWLSALRNAQRSVFIQSPTLNAEPLLPAIIEACERGVDVTCYVCLGYNDAGEILPRQNGHNEAISAYLHFRLGPNPQARSRLHWYWYVAKDQTKPLVQSKKARSCHVKLMIVDHKVGIMGNGNQDTQSWFHSQEINVMVDSEEVCRQWMEGIDRNQNTRLFGKVDGEDGVWRDEEGKEAEGAMGVEVGRFGWAKGIVGAVKRVRGIGGF